MSDHQNYANKARYEGEEEEDEIFLQSPVDEDVVLIDLIRGYRHLYDKADKWYKDTEAQAASWAEIAKVLEKPVNVLQSRWNTIKKKFTVERQQREREFISGSAASRRKKWHLYEYLSFLENTIRRRKAFSNVDIGQINHKQPRLAQSSGCEQYSMDNNSSEFINYEVIRTDDSNFPPHQTSSASYNIVHSELTDINFRAPTPPRPSSTPSRTLSAPPRPLSAPPRPLSAPPRPSSTFCFSKNFPVSSSGSFPLQTESSSSSEMIASPATSPPPTSDTTFRQPFNFRNPKKTKSPISNEDPYQKSIERLTASITTMSEHVLNRPEQHENLRDNEYYIGCLVANKLRELEESKKTELINKIMQLLFSQH